MNNAKIQKFLRNRKSKGFSCKAVFLDRDGVINKKTPEMNFVKNASEIVYLPRVSHVIKMIKEKGYLAIIVSNQSGINRGIIKKENLEKINEKLKKDLGIDGIYYCPHLPEEKCSCRKPKTGLIDMAVKDFKINIKNSMLIGDNQFDIDAGKSAGCKTFMVDGSIGISQAEDMLKEA